MMCEKCGKYKATTHIRTIINGVLHEQKLCSNCANEEGLNLSPQTSLSGMLASMLGEFPVVGAKTEKKCPICGAAFENIAQSGKAGCAECYKTFKAELLPYLKRVHGSTKHIGKIPNDTIATSAPCDDTVSQLKIELKRLVSEEKYEQAAVVRDQIKKLEADGNE